jgi:hypothetical protein
VTKEKGENAGKHYYANIEGKEYPWDRETITVGDIRILGKLPAGLAVVEEAPGGKERTLSDYEIVVLKPEHRYGRAPKFKRG